MPTPLPPAGRRWLQCRARTTPNSSENNAPPAWLQVTGFKAYADVSGTRVLSTFGIDAAKLTTWIVVLDCLYPACLALAFALLYWNLPRPQALRGQRGGAGASAAH